MRCARDRDGIDELRARARSVISDLPMGFMPANNRSVSPPPRVVNEKSQAPNFMARPRFARLRMFEGGI